MKKFVPKIKLNTLFKLMLVMSMIFFFTSIFVKAYFAEQTSTLFKKEFHGIDDRVNAAVAGNVTRLFFPTKVRINSLFEKFTGDWTQGPQWQHIPPLFAYASLPFFWLDGHVSIEMFRLSFAVLVMLTGVLFIVTISLFTRSMLGAAAATLSAIIWSLAPMSKNLIYGFAFGVSDIVLAFTVIFSFMVICWYLNKTQEKRVKITFIKLCIIAFVTTWPILVKSVLGAMPLVTLLGLLLYDHKKINPRVVAAFFTVFITLYVYYGSLYLSSPETFRVEIMTSFNHFGNYEGWQRPWDFYITNYLPESYFKDFWYAYVTFFFFAIHILATNKFERRITIVLKIALGWFVWNLVVLSLVTSKAPNFIYQTYLLIIFLMVFTIFWQLQKIYPFITNIPYHAKKGISFLVLPVLSVTILFFTFWQFITAADLSFSEFRRARNLRYDYVTSGEKFYELAEAAQNYGAGLKDIFIIKPLSDDDKLLYYMIFLTGSEVRSSKEIAVNKVTPEQLSRKYDRLHIIVPSTTELTKIPNALAITRPTNNFQLVTFDLRTINQSLNINAIVSAI